MMLSIEEAAQRLGRPARTVRAQCASGHLPAVKKGRAWQIDSSALEPVASQRQQTGGRWHEARQVVESVFPPAPPTPGAPQSQVASQKTRASQFGVRQLETFQAGLRACTLLLSGREVSPAAATSGVEELRATLSVSPLAGPAEAASALLVLGLKQLSFGYYSFDPVRKRAAYEQARLHFSHALVELAVLQALLQQADASVPGVSSGGGDAGVATGAAESEAGDALPAAAPSALMGVQEALRLLEGPTLGGLGGLLGRMGRRAGRGEDSAPHAAAGQTQDSKPPAGVATAAPVNARRRGAS